MIHYRSQSRKEQIKNLLENVDATLVKFGQARKEDLERDRELSESKLPTLCLPSSGLTSSGLAGILMVCVREREVEREGGRRRERGMEVRDR